MIVDAADYFRHVRSAMLMAQHSIMLIGWDFDGRITLDRDTAAAGDVPAKLTDFILWLADRRPDLQINILQWNFGAYKLIGHGHTLVAATRWALHKRITFKLDGAHPAGASHHQKIVIIDDALAVCGGIDMTADRWDTCGHLDDDPRRVRPNGKPYPPWHDITLMMDGAGAAAMGELARDRWVVAGGAAMPAARPPADIWPDGLEPDFRNIDIAISRTRAAHADVVEVREIEMLYLDMIASAQRHIYIENQYFASRKIAEAIAKRMAEPDPPEIVIVAPLEASGWLEQVAMDSARARLVHAILKVDHRQRFRMYHPVTAGGTAIYVHAKLMVVDDICLRIGSSNMNNRSLGIDSECDVLIDSRTASGNMVAQTIADIRSGLMAEHLGVTVETIRAEVGASGSLIATIGKLRGQGRTLVPYSLPELSETEAKLADSALLDPEHPDEIFEPMSSRGLFRRRHVLPKPDLPTASGT